jgi:DNA (cytosine-5)-methyltransferase 1
VKQIQTRVPVIDIFAGPGGLGEGFSAYPIEGTESIFKIRLSLEKEENAHRTLQLRAFFRQFRKGEAPEGYYRLLRQEITLSELYAAYPAEAKAAANEALQVTLGLGNWEFTREKIVGALDGAKEWLLIGGPPCQAYSLAGRARNKGVVGYDAREDSRHFLYHEYLRILATFRPSVFVMENVKGILSSKPEGSFLFEKIKQDLRHPGAAMQTSAAQDESRSDVSYRLFSLAPTGQDSFVIRTEQHGIPQARHRVIIIGVREDLGSICPEPLQIQEPVPLGQVINDLPRIRSGITRAVDSTENWLNIIRLASDRRWFLTIQRRAPHIASQLESAVAHIRAPKADRGAEFIPHQTFPAYMREWYSDPNIGGICNHYSRPHMQKDLYRYFYAACFAQAENISPKLRDFPIDLLPNHANVADAIEGNNLFQDRFRVQLPDRPSTTVTSHISKDGHAFIHYDPTQCRSMTVREAARAQTFPDNYLFTGSRTAQYTQVGNAVPPLLATQIADRVYRVLDQAGIIQKLSS